MVDLLAINWILLHDPALLYFAVKTIRPLDLLVHVGTL